MSDSVIGRLTDGLLIGKIIYEACRARDNGHKVEGGRPDWFHLPDGARANAKAVVDAGTSEDPLAQAILDCYGVKAPKPVKAAPAITAIASPRAKVAGAKMATKRKAKAKR